MACWRSSNYFHITFFFSLASFLVLNNLDRACKTLCVITSVQVKGVGKMLFKSAVKRYLPNWNLSRGIIVKKNMKTFMSFLFFAVNKHSFCASFTETCSTVGIYEFIIKVLEMMRKHFKKTKKMNNKISKLFISIKNHRLN